MRQENPAYRLNLNNLYSQNGVNNYILSDNESRNNFQRTKQSIIVQPRLAIKRAVPPLLQPVLTKNSLKTSDPFSSRLKFSRLPDLHRISGRQDPVPQGIIMNGQNNPRGYALPKPQVDPNTMTFSNFLAEQNSYNPLSLRQCTAADLKNKVIYSRGCKQI